MALKTELPKADKALVAKIGRRTEAMAATTGVPWSALEAAYVVGIVHLNTCPLRLKELLESGDMDFSQEMYGLKNNVVPQTGKLRPTGWKPKFAQLSTPLERAIKGTPPRKKPAKKKAAQNPWPQSTKGPILDLSKKTLGSVEAGLALALAGGKPPLLSAYRMVMVGTGEWHRWTVSFEADAISTALGVAQDAAKNLRSIPGFAAVELYEAIGDVSRFVARAAVDKDPSVKISFDPPF